MPQEIEIRTSPHIKTGTYVNDIMRHVVYALLPICGFAVYQFGMSALLLLIIVTGSCLLTEALFNYLSDKENTLNDYSAIITGLLLALTLPPGFPLWMGVVAGFIAISLGKVLFGGLGFNVLNPALVGRAFVQAAFPVAITTWTPPYITNRFVEFIPSTLTFPFSLPTPVTSWIQGLNIDSLSSATPLGHFKFAGLDTANLDLFTGMTAGSLGENSALLILVCGLYLAFRKMLNWRIPAAILLSTFLLSAFFYWLDGSKYPDPFFMLFSGGLMLGAVFMATDMVTAPLTPTGIWLYGFIIGFVTVLIRLFGGLPEGIMYAILLGNVTVPLLEAITQPRIYGSVKK
ncbi:MAG: RnfABCDGE type electron transport complex subunit D [Candidatus Parabeggiatoa sp.]|nr:RnfABCDGE type electron transport complex subunit D [Candidatus Parabeggiatoa sp.]